MIADGGSAKSRRTGDTSVASIAKGDTRTGLAGDSPSCGQKGQTHQRARRVAPRWLRRTPGTPGLSVPMVNSPPGIETSRGPRSVASLSSVRVDAGDSTAVDRTVTSSDTASRLNLSDPHPLRGTRTSDGMCALFGEARCAPLRLLAVLARCRGTGLLLG